MKEKMRALLVKNPEVTLPEAARALNANERNCKSVRVAYWKARALLWEELSDESLRELLIRKGAYEGPFDNGGPLVEEEIVQEVGEDNEGPFESDDARDTNEGPDTEIHWWDF